MLKIYREFIAQARKQKVSRKGMTLIEIMIVLVIMASMMALIGVNVFGAMDTAGEKTTGIQLESFKNAVSQYKVFYKKLPNSLEDLINTPDGRSLLDSAEIPRDSWDNEFTFEKTGNKIKIFSNGADGLPNTEDDIVINM